ncbi:MAG: hypothetical protein ABWY14_19630 [Tardiphaga sp.]
MKHPLLFALTAIGLSVSAAHADPVRVAQAIPGMLPASEVAAVVRSAGFVPISPAMRRGNSYVLRASAPDGREVRVIVGARNGEIVSASPVVAAAPAGERLGPAAPIPNVPPRAARAAVPEAREYGPPPSAEPPMIMGEERGEHGLLPPPPDRFPPRAVAPAEKPAAARPASVKRAAATPLPKPKPATEAAPPTGEVQRWGEQPATPAAPPAPAPSVPEGKVDARALPH